MEENTLDPETIMRSQPKKYRDPLVLKEKLVRDYPGALYTTRENEIPIYPKQIRSKA